MEEQGCPRCKTTKYRNPSLKLLVNVCGHSLCESCVELLFVKGSGLCPECGTSLRRSTFRLQIFEDASVEKEIDIRKRVLRDFNKKEEDFPSLQEYNDYLEMIETIVFNLTNHQDVEATKKMIDQYKKENKDQIKKNLSKLSKDEEFLETLIEQEQHETTIRKMILLEEEKKEKAAKRKSKEALIDALMYQDRPAHDIISSHKELAQHEELEAKRATTAFSTGIKIGHRSDIVPLNKQETAQLYRYCPLVIEWCGPEPPTVDELYTDGYLRNIRTISDAERAGGFREALACHRALQDAFSGLYSFPNVSAPSPAKRKSFPQTAAHSPMITS
ncbi:CDK-activating kinase assembly factor MAT1 [Biomphalaria glabrata]|uniref:CDK-activating kinase assembly factor MAT1 n=1 Tax=Biomphalaria glabrata TaxID=6526 RepID=A0A9W2ZVC0_BIOGL|nr:CDK-activating kinase assembly factor MAT1-like [Biomphalaria glabrata]KAI8740706.1 CDK-activating kinase assembly factor MAT1-like [Biomphalaria glabrata]